MTGPEPLHIQRIPGLRWREKTLFLPATRALVSLDELGWIGGRIELVGESLVFADDPGRYLAHLDRQRTATAAEVRSVARSRLTAPAFVLAVHGSGAEDE